MQKILLVKMIISFGLDLIETEEFATKTLRHKVSQSLEKNATKALKALSASWRTTKKCHQGTKSRSFTKKCEKKMLRRFSKIFGFATIV